MPKRKFWPKNRRTVIVAAAVVLVAGGLLIYEWHHHAKPATKPAATPMGPETPQVDRSNPSSGSPKGSSNTSNATINPQAPTDQSHVNDSLTAPSGQLAGTKQPPSGSTAAITASNASLSANCLTVAGASCVVKLTGPSGQIVTINPSTNDGQGSFTFSWNGSGYATGLWQVSLVATKDGQTATANIGPLTVEP